MNAGEVQLSYIYNYTKYLLSYLMFPMCEYCVLMYVKGDL